MKVDIDANARMSTLSVAKQQMVEIAKAVTNQASILIMDEPTSAITQHEIRTLFKIIDQLKAKGVAVVYISHKLDEVFEIADRITVQRDGRTVATTESSQTNENEVITRMVGREVSDLYPKVDAVVGDELLRVEHLSGPGYQDVSFTLRRGEILGFSGLMGSGRTEIMRGIYGMDKTTEGEIYLRGSRIQVRSPQDAIRAGIGLVSEDRKNEGLVLQMSVRENVTLAALERCCRNRILSKRIEADFTAREIKRFNIKTSSQSRAVATLSGGNQQKVVLGKTLLNEPDVLILDEPTRGIDVGAKAEIYRFISTLASQGKGILMVSSEMPEVLGMSDRVIVIHEGRKRGELERSDATQESIMRLALSSPSESLH
jgi:ABC-type sugar transport system ATPase subunit